jgi:peptidoglycan/xylan/chitin deacetylase (PgdA/CDA1 family)
VHFVTKALITIDTELSAGLFQRGADAAVNFAASIEGPTTRGSVGIGWQMDRLDAHGVKGVFFVDPMPALVYGPDVIARMVQPIVVRGHDVQLHIHTEWLEWARRAPVAARGRNIADFDFDDQVTLIGCARDLLVAAGVPSPIAFRAGNYGANDTTLRALAALGIAWDASFNPAYLGAPCDIDLPADTIDPLQRLGVAELPVAAIHDRPGQLRHAQICALSSREMTAALDHAATTGRPAFAIVSHSFEMLSRDRKRPNRAVMARFEHLCRTIADHPDLESSGFGALPLPNASNNATRLAPDRWRTMMRQIEQAAASLRYERALRTA